jgi:hypothetical protein
MFLKNINIVKPFWDQLVNCYAPLSLLVSISLVLSFVIYTVLGFWHDYYKRLNIYIKVHEVLHYIRLRFFDEYSQLLADDCSKQEVVNTYLINLSYKICQDIEDFLNTCFEDSSKLGLGCSIRIANEATAKNIKFSTFGRSKQLSERTVTSINRTGKLVKTLFDHSSQVLLLKDVRATDIESDGIWDTADSDCDKSIRSVLVCPIWFRILGEPDADRDLLGILYLSSNQGDKKCPFTRIHAELGAALADVLGCVYMPFLA